MAAQSAPSRAAPRLYLATPPATDPAALAAVLVDLVTAADVAAVLLRTGEADERTAIRQAKAVAPAVQNADVALLLDRPSLVTRAGADGAHVSGISAMQEALSALKPDRIVGVGGLATRHDAMVAGESGADYVLFGEPDARGTKPSAEAVFERLQWWAEVFELPCVGYAASAEEAGLFAAAGADFILLGDFVWQDPRGPRAAVTDAAARIAGETGRAPQPPAAADPAE